MLMDLQEVMSDDQSLAINVGTALSTKSRDLGVAGTDALGNTVLKDFGSGNPIEAFVQITGALTSATNTATLAVELISADDAGLTSNVTSLLKSAAIAQATCIPGYLFRLGDVPHRVAQRYLGFRYTIAGENGTGGTVRAGFVPRGAVSSQFNEIS